MLKQVLQGLLKLLRKILAPLAPPVFPDDEDKTRRAKYANTIALIFLVAVILWEGWAKISQLNPAFEFVDVILFGIVVVCIVGLVRLRQGHVRTISIALIVMLWIGCNGMAIQYGVKDVSFISNFAVILMAGLLLGQWAAAIVTGLSIVVGLVLGFAQEAGRLHPEAFPMGLFGVTMAVILVIYAIVLYSLIDGLERALRKSRQSVEELGSANAILSFTQGELQNRSTELTVANQQLENRSRKLHGIAEVARTTTAIRSFDELLQAITSGISQELGYYHVGLFMLDEQKQYAILRSANTAEGLRMISRGYRVAVGSISPIGYIAQTGQPRITRAVEDDSRFLGNVDFPETHSQIVLPLGSGDNVIGVLDIQSREANAFSPDDLSILSILSDQVATAIQNALLYEQSQTALREADVASRQVAGQAWAEYGGMIQTRGYRYDGIKSEVLKDAKQARRESDALTVPVQLRDQTIGCLRLKSSEPGRQWTDDELSMVRATAERVALALEGARLLDEAQKRARREAFLSEVTAKLGTSIQLDSILRDTVEELGQTLKNSTVTFQLVSPSEPYERMRPNSGGAPTDGNKAE